MEIVKLSEDDILDSFSNHLDIYYKPYYWYLYESYGDGTPYVAFLKKNNIQVIYPFLLREVPNTPGYYDISTVYGYSGPVIYNSERSENVNNIISDFGKRFNDYCKGNNIVSEFVRLNPLLKNHEYLNEIYDIEYVRDTVFVNLNDELKIWDNIHSKKRNMIRKAKKNNVFIEIVNSPTKKQIDVFYKLYMYSMKKQNASEYYYFNIEFFTDTILGLENNSFLVNAHYENQVVSSNIILTSGSYAHYHFSGSLPDGMKVAANDLLLYETIKYLSANGYEYFHLGGGYKDNSDSLFKFKSRFNKHGNIPFYVGKKIHIPSVYEKLVADNNVNPDTHFFPAYRANL